MILTNNSILRFNMATVITYISQRLCLNDIWMQTVTFFHTSSYTTPQKQIILVHLSVADLIHLR